MILSVVNRVVLCSSNDCTLAAGIIIVSSRNFPESVSWPEVHMPG